MNKEQSKRKNRNGDPSPTIHCSWGWCNDASKTPPTLPEPAPRAGATNDRNTNSGREGSDTVPMETCGTAMRKALAAAHNVDVGDQYFVDRNYNGALARYKDAAEEKPADVAIHVRLGRVLEKLNQLSQAMEAYDAAQTLPRVEKWTDEAKSSLSRLKHATHSQVHAPASQSSTLA
jgi:tetratricopeptide (TPR) repeat protein